MIKLFKRLFVPKEKIEPEIKIGNLCTEIKHMSNYQNDIFDMIVGINEEDVELQDLLCGQKFKIPLNEFKAEWVTL